MNQETKRSDLIALGLFVIGCLAIGGVGGLLTSSSVQTWYPGLAKPPWNPPAFVFGPVWTTLYIMMGVAAWMVWKQRAADRSRALALFGVQLGLNLAWSALFFGLQRPDLALLEIVLLLAAIAATAVAFRRHSRVAAWLFVPYLLWVSYATSLNAAIWYLNR